MNWTRLRNRLRGQPPALEQELDEELAFHAEMKQRDLMGAGLSEREARDEVRRQLGNLTLAREDARDAWTLRWAVDFWRDLQYGARTLAAQPGYTAAAVLALVLGIGVNAILFNVYNTLAFAPWAIRDSGQAAQILADRGTGRWNGVSWPHYRYLRDHSRSLAGAVAYASTGVRITRGEESWDAAAQAVSENFFDVIGTGFAAGRGFSPNTNLRAPAPETVLHYETWVNRFGSDPTLIGQWINLNGHQMQVVGVAAPGFSGPVPVRPQLWIPGPWRDIFHPGLNSIDDPNTCCVDVLARLNPGVTRAAAQAELNTLTSQFLTSVKREPRGVLVTEPSLLANPTTRDRVTAPFVALAVATMLILLLACANVANLQLARSLSRRREIAVRLSLGAGRGRILRQLFAESLLLSLLAGAASTALAAAVPQAILRAIVGEQEPISLRFENDWRVLAFILGVTFLAALLFGLAPAWSAVREALAAGLREGGRVTTGHRLRTLLLAAQVFLCAVLLGGASLLLRALDQARSLDVGFRYDNVVLFSPHLGSSGVDDEQARALLAPLRERVAQLPGVESVGLTTIAPFSNSFDSTSIDHPRTKERVVFGFSRVSAGFFASIGVPLLAGRDFTASDESRQDVIIVNESLARRLWPGENALGQSLNVMRAPMQVVGVVRDFSTRELGPGRELNAYVPSAGTRMSSLLVRHAGDAAPLLSGLPRLGRSLDRRFLPSAVRLADNVARARRSASTAAAVAGILSALALLLACVGIYAVSSYGVAQRTREIGVRMALGARRTAIQRLILGQNLRTVIAGAALGVAGAIGFGRLLSGMLYGVPPGDPLALTGTLSVLLLTALLAAWAPARRAASVDPAVTLRHE